MTDTEPRNGPLLLRERWAAGEATFGLFCDLESPYALELVGEAGFDWALIDLQHNASGIETTALLLNIIAQSNTAPMVRVAVGTPWMIERALDLGAQGVIVPMVESAAEAQQAVSAARYPPVGKRSFSPFRSSSAIGVNPVEVNDRVAIIAMIESKQGLENLDEIAATPGLDGIFVGPYDLRLSLGSSFDEPLDDAISERILNVCAKRGLTPGIYGATGQAAYECAQRGFRIIACATDRELLLKGLREDLGAARNGAPEVRASYARQSLRSSIVEDL
jgi:4-hydroxy-2-oxoheptanedioate aldolase